MRTDRILAVTTEAALMERRAQQRKLCSNLAEIAFEDQQGREVRQQALVEDVSNEGVCVSSSLPLAEGWRVTASLPKARCATASSATTAS
jgi:hypothetical protein